MIGYEIKTASGNGRKSLIINLYNKDNYGWELFGQIEYSGASDSTGFNNFNYNLLSSNKTGFGQYMKFGTKLIDRYYDAPDFMLDFIANTRGMKRLINDTRLNTVSTIQTIEKSVNFEGFKIYVNGQYYEDILAKDTQDAKKRIFAHWVKNDSHSLIENFVKNGEIVQRSYNTHIVIRSIDEILNRF